MIECDPEAAAAGEDMTDETSPSTGSGGSMPTAETDGRGTIDFCTLGMFIIGQYRHAEEQRKAGWLSPDRLTSSKPRKID